MREHLLKVLEFKNANLWDYNIVEPKINLWLANFKGKKFPKETEDLMALYLLSKVVVITNDELNYLCCVALREYIKSRTDELDLRNSDLETEKNIRNSTRYYGVGNPSESGFYMLYLFRQANHMSTELFLDPMDLLDKERKTAKFDTLCLIDDVSLTGETIQASSKSLQSIECDKICVLPLIATPLAIRTIQSMGMDVISPLILDDLEIKLGPKSPLMMDFLEVERFFSKDDFVLFLSYYGSKVEMHPLGFGGLGLLLAMEHNVPDCTLPIIWSDREWFPIIPRKSKF